MAFEKLRDRWEQMAPRERRLAMMLGITFVVLFFGWIGFSIRGGLADLEKKNESTRAALKSIDEHRDELTGGKTIEATAPADDVSLSTYLSVIANDVGVKLPETTESTKPAKGKFEERSVEVTLRNITIDQLAMFLKRVETDRPGVVTQHMNVKPYRNDHVHMDVELTIAAFVRTEKAPAPGKGKGAGDKKDEGQKPATDEGEGG
jgi:type II secretory pathway component PulM